MPAVLSDVAKAVLEIELELTSIAPEHEGLRDYARLNIGEDARGEVAARLAAYDQRVGLLTAALVANQALVADGHPEQPVREVSASALADLQNQLDTITAARALFTSNAAAGMGLAAGTPKPKATP